MTILEHGTGAQTTLLMVLRQHPAIVSPENPLALQDGYRTKWDKPPTDVQLRTKGYSYLVEVEKPTPGEGEQVRQGPHELVNAAWTQTWIVEPIPVVVPEAAQPHLLRRVLAAKGLLGSVETYISSLPADAPMRIDWEWAPSLRRSAQGVESARQELGLTSEQVDALWIAAAAAEDEV